MKRLVSVLVIAMLAFSFAACNRDDEGVVDSSSVPEASEAVSSMPVVEELEPVQEEYRYYQKDSSNYMEVEYKDDGVNVKFVGDNEFWNWNGIIKNSDLLMGEGDLLVDTKGSIEELAIFFIWQEDGVLVTSNFNNQQNGVLYVRDSEIEKAMIEYTLNTSGKAQEWSSRKVTSDVSDVDISAVNPTMTTTYNNGELNATITGTGIPMLENLTATLTGDYVFMGEFEGGQISIMPENGVLNVSIRYEDTKTITLEFVKK